MSTPDTKRAASDFLPPPNEQKSLQHPSANGPSSSSSSSGGGSSSSTGRGKLSSTEALKGALGINLEEGPAAAAAANDGGSRGGRPLEAGSRDGTSETETTAAAAARLKGMLGVGASNTSQASAGASTHGSSRTAEAGISLKRTDAMSVSRTVGTEKATAELKAMIGVGGGGGGEKRSPEILGGDDERRVADGSTHTRQREKCVRVE